MKCIFVIVAALSVGHAQANVGDFFKELFGGKFTSPMDAVNNGESCQGIANTFNENPSRTYKWMIKDNNAQNFIRNLDAKCAEPVAHAYAAAIVRKGQKDKQKNNDKYQASMDNLDQIKGLIKSDGPKDEVAAFLDVTPACLPKHTHPEIITNLVADVSDLGTILKGNTERQAIKACAPLVNNKVKVVSQTQNLIVNAYGIRPRGEGKYDILLNYQFKEFAGTDGKGPIPKAKELAERTRKCFAEASPYMRGPNGEQLTLISLTPEELNALPVGQQPPPYEIEIVEVSDRGHSKAYNDTFHCPTIIHETMHALGLCDEYLENDPTYRGLCRVTGLPNTIMNNMIDGYNEGIDRQLECSCDQACQTAEKDPSLRRLYTAPGFRDVLDQDARQYCKEIRSTPGRWIPHAQRSTVQNLSGRIEGERVIFTGVEISGAPLENDRINQNYVIEYIDWNCDCSDPSFDAQKRAHCQKQLKRLKDISHNVAAVTKAKTCPGNSYQKSVAASPTSQGALDRVENGTFIRVLPAQTPSLLAPTHFNRIIAGTCENEATSNYRECAKWAYEERPSDQDCKTNGADGKPTATCLEGRSKDTCAGRSAQCQDPNYYLGLPK